MPTRTVSVEISARDPNNLRDACYKWCRDNLDMVAGVDKEKAAELLLRGFLRTTDHRTTGADALSVTVNEWPE